MRTRSVMGAVLAGGGSRRMGRDKALLELEGKTLVARAADTLRFHLDEVTIVSARKGDHALADLPEIADRLPDKGPLGGIHAALHYAEGRPVFVLACDLPRIGPELVGLVLDRARRAAASSEPPGVVAVELGGRIQPLCGVYSARCLEPLEERIRAGRLKTLDLATEVGLSSVSLTAELPFFREDLLLNVNGPSEARAVGANLPERSEA